MSSSEQTTCAEQGVVIAKEVSPCNSDWAMVSSREHQQGSQVLMVFRDGRDEWTGCYDC